MAAKPFTHHVQLRFSDTDAMGHVNNARFLSYVEDARIAFLNEISGDAGNPTYAGLILARTEIDYVTPLTLSPAPVEVTVWVSRIGTKSFALDYTITQASAVAARAKSVVVGYDYASGRSRPLSTEEREALDRHLVSDPETVPR